jgi:acyl carrier protein
MSEEHMSNGAEDWPEEFETLLRRHCRLVPENRAIDADALLPALGVDSLEVIELIVSIEDTFELTMPADLLTPEVFLSARSVWRHVSGLLAGSAHLDVSRPS